VTDDSGVSEDRVAVGGRAEDRPAGSDQADQRRAQILRAALEVIAERGFADTRIADVAERVDVSSALVVYYFKTKDRLLAEAIRYAEDLWYEEGTKRLAAQPTALARLEELVRLTCLPQSDPDMAAEAWTLWLDLWAQAIRQPAVGAVREEFDERWRQTIRQVVRDGQDDGEFAALDADDFAVSLSALLDGFAVQIALGDPVVGPQRAFELSMRLAAAHLGFTWTPTARKRPGKRPPRARR